MSLTADLCDRLHFFEKLLENKHMNDTTNDTNMTGNADNRSELRTNCGHGINHDVQVDVAIPFRSRDEAIIALCQKVFGAWPVYVSDCDQPTTAPSDVFARIGEEERSYALAQYHLACSRLSIGSSSSDPGDTLLEAVCRLKSELETVRSEHLAMTTRWREADEQIVSSEAAFSKFRDSISRALDAANTPTHHPDIGAPARKPKMSTERIKALAKQRDEARAELAETRKDYHCLAELLDGHDATECRANLMRMKQELDEANSKIIALTKSHDVVTKTFSRVDNELAEARSAVKNLTHSIISAQGVDAVGRCVALIRRQEEILGPLGPINDFRLAELLSHSLQQPAELKITQLTKQRDTLAEALRNAEPHMRHNLNCNARLTDGELGCTCGMIKDRVAVINALAAVKGGEA